MESILAAIALAIIGYVVGSVKIVNEGNKGIVERLGRFNRTLEPGLNFVIPMLDNVLVESMREQLLDIEPQATITRDNVSVMVDAILYWKVLDVKKAFYAVEDLERALENLVITTLRSEVGEMDLKETISSRNKINQVLLKELDEAAENWGVKIMRVEVQKLEISKTMQESLETERAAESKRKAEISASEGTVQSIRMISEAIQAQPNAKAVLQYLVAQRFVDANVKLGQSNNSKIIFMDPKVLSDTVGELIASDEAESLNANVNVNGNGGA